MIHVTKRPVVPCPVKSEVKSRLLVFVSFSFSTRFFYLLNLVFTSYVRLSASNIRRRINLSLISVFCPNKSTDDEYATEFAYVACAYACVASENQA